MGVVTGKGSNDQRVKGTTNAQDIDSTTKLAKPGDNQGQASMAAVKSSNLKGEGGPT